jgi:hypothetical protein
MKKIVLSIMYIASIFLLSCSSPSNENNKMSVDLDNKLLISGQNVKINYDSTFDYASVVVKLKSLGSDNTIETYDVQDYSGSYVISRFLNKDVSYNDSYYFEVLFYSNASSEVNIVDINIAPSVIVKSLCASTQCETLSGNVVQNTVNTVKVSFFKFAPIKIEYLITTPNDTYKFDHEFTSPVDEDWLGNLVFNSVPEDTSSYINNIAIIAYDEDGNVVETSLPFRVVRPIEVKHFGAYELAETYEPIPVTGCIPGSIGNNVQYSESESEMRQNSVSVAVSNNWNNSNSSTVNLTETDGVSISETEATITSSSLSASETASESETSNSTLNEGTNISFSSTDGETWGWNIDESSSQGTTNSDTNSTNLGVNGSVTTGFSGEGSLPFLAKVSGKVEVTAGVSANRGNASTQSENESSSTSRGYTTGGTAVEGRTFGSINNESRSHSLSGTYVLSSSTSNTITESSGLTSGRIWNMSESVSSGNVVSEGSSESLSETIVTSGTSSTTFSYSAYIPRGRFGIFYRQTSRYVKLSEIITYDLNGYPQHAGYITMNSWAWAPELSIGDDCNNMPNPSLPRAYCHIPPCGE